VGWFFFQADGLAILVELHHAVALWVPHGVRENNRAVFQLGSAAQHFRQAVPKENIIAQYQAGAFARQKFFANQKGIRQAARNSLNSISKRQTPLGAIPQQALIQKLLFGRGDYQYFPDARQHQHGQGVINHWFIVNRQQLLADCHRERVEPGTFPACQNNSLHVQPFLSL